MLSSLETVAMPEAKTSPDRQGRNCRGRLLTAEDAQCIQMILGAILQKMNLEVDTAENGKEACDKAMASLAEGRPYDVILMDMQMPKMNGCQAAQWLRKHDWQGPIIAVSIHATNKDHEEFVKAGCNSYIAKPVNETSLREVLSPYLQPA
jgi:CheY-like chemotaxis protein